MADESTTNKCGHSSCNCTVATNEKYCSEYCKEAKKVTEIGCGCEHAPCR